MNSTSTHRFRCGDFFNRSTIFQEGRGTSNNVCKVSGRDSDVAFHCYVINRMFSIPRGNTFRSKIRKITLIVGRTPVTDITKRHSSATMMAATTMMTCNFFNDSMMIRMQSTIGKVHTNILSTSRQETARRGESH